MKKALIAAAFVAASGGPAWATTVEPMYVSEIVRGAELIFVGTLTESASYYEDNRTTIRTYLTFTNLTVKKGKIDGTSYVLRHGGGTVGRETIWMADFPRFRLGRRYLLYVHGNRKYDSPIVGFHQGAFEVAQVKGREVLKNMSGAELIGVKDDRFVFLGQARPQSAGGLVTDPNFKPVPAKPNASEIEAREALARKAKQVQRLPVELPSPAPVVTKPPRRRGGPVKLTPDDPGDQPPPKVATKPASDKRDRNAFPITVLPKDDDGKRITLSRFLTQNAEIR